MNEERHRFGYNTNKHQSGHLPAPTDYDTRFNREQKATRLATSSRIFLRLNGRTI